MQHVAGIAAWALPLALYLGTAAPTVYGVDSADLTTAAYLLGLSHPPGAPTYLLAAHVWTWLPIGDVGYRVNLLSCVAGALACFFVYRIVVRLCGDVWLGVATAWLIATSYYVWTACVAAELYAPQGCVVAALVLLALRFRDAPTGPRFSLLCLLAGLGLGVHLSLVLMLPGLALLALAPPLSPRRPTILLAGALCGVLGASVFLYLPLRFLSDLPLNPARDYWQVDLATWDGFWWMVSGAGFRHHLLSVAAPSLPAELATFAFRVWSNFLGLPSLLGLVGLASGLRRRPWVHAALLLMLLGHVAFYVTYGARDKDAMFVPAYLLWGIWIGLGARVAAGQVAQALIGGPDPPWLGAAAVACIVALLVPLNYPWADISADRSARDRGETILAALEPDAVFVGAWSDLRLVEYLQQVDGRRRDITPVDTFFLPPAERARRIEAALESRRPVYLTACENVPDPRVSCEYERGCYCYRLRPMGGTAEPSTSQGLRID